MDRNQAKELLPIIKAYVEGKTIQLQHIDCTWQDAKYLNLGRGLIYRIKPEPKYRPFANAKECWTEMQKHRPFGWVKRFGNYTQIIALDNNTITLSNSIGKSTFLSYKDYKQITFADGSVFGVKVED